MTKDLVDVGAIADLLITHYGPTVLFTGNKSNDFAKSPCTKKIGPSFLIGTTMASADFSVPFPLPRGSGSLDHQTGTETSQGKT